MGDWRSKRLIRQTRGAGNEQPAPSLAKRKIVDHLDFIFPFARFKTFAFQANSFSMFLILNIEYPPAMQIAWGSKNNCGTNLNIEVLAPICPKALRAGRIRNFEQQKFFKE